MTFFANFYRFHGHLADFSKKADRHTIARHEAVNLRIGPPNPVFADFGETIDTLAPPSGRIYQPIATGPPPNDTSGRGGHYLYRALFRYGAPFLSYEPKMVRM